MCHLHPNNVWPACFAAQRLSIVCLLVQIWIFSGNSVLMVSVFFDLWHCESCGPQMFSKLCCPCLCLFRLLHGAHIASFSSSDSMEIILGAVQIMSIKSASHSVPLLTSIQVSLCAGETSSTTGGCSPALAPVPALQSLLASPALVAGTAFRQ